MLEGRLKRRDGGLTSASYGQYCDYVFDGRGHEAEEMVQLIDAVTTNKTDFFRESVHFDFLASQGSAPADGAQPAARRAADLECGLFHRRRTVHPGHGAERIPAVASRLSLPDSGDGHFDRGPGTRPRAAFSLPMCCDRCPRALRRNVLSCAAAIRIPTCCGWFRSCARWLNFGT